MLRVLHEDHEGTKNMKGEDNRNY